MMNILSFLVSWLCGMLAILISAFYTYDQFSIIDITSFAVFTFAGYLLLFLSVYLIALRFINLRVPGPKQFIYFPLIYAGLANLPVYIIIWINMPALYGRGEATLFTLGFITSAFVFGLFRAWINRMRRAGKSRVPQ